MSFPDAVKEGITGIDFGRLRGPCRAMAPQFERAAQLRHQYRFAKVDVDAEPGSRAGRDPVDPYADGLVTASPACAATGSPSRSTITVGIERIA